MSTHPDTLRLQRVMVDLQSLQAQVRALRVENDRLKVELEQYEKNDVAVYSG